MDYPKIYNFKTPDWRDYRCFVDDGLETRTDNSGPADGEGHNQIRWKRQDVLYEAEILPILNSVAPDKWGKCGTPTNPGDQCHAEFQVP